MSFRPSARQVLILFVVAWTAWIAIQAWRNWPGSAEADTGIAVAGPAKANRVVVYYFHVTVRCTTCRTIQAYTDEALKNGFHDALAIGNLDFRPVNIQLQENRHFVQDYKLYAQSVVIARFSDGRQTEWKNLESVWDLTESKPAFVSYVRRHVREYLARL